MRRVSRERWLSPKTVREIAMRFARLAGSGDPSRTAKAAVGEVAFWATGMLKGRTVSVPGMPGHGLIVDFAQRFDAGKTRCAMPEIRILQLIVQFPERREHGLVD